MRIKITISIKRLNEDIKTYIEDYLRWSMSFKCPKKNRQKTKRAQEYNLRFFLGYLIKIEKFARGRIKRKNLCNLLERYFENYFDYLVERYDQTTTIKRLLSFTNSLVDFSVRKGYYKDSDCKIKNLKSHLLSQIEFKASNNFQKKLQRLSIIDSRKLFITISEMNYTDWYTCQKALILNLLMRMGWRATNITSLQIGKNMKKINDVWNYYFKPEEQKNPLMINNMQSSVNGILPVELGKILDKLLEYRAKSEIESENIIITKRLKPMSVNTFSANVKRYTQEIYGVDINPHLFRDLVSTAFYNDTYREGIVDVWLWHFPDVKSSTKHYLHPDVNKAVKEINNFLNSFITKIKQA